LTRRVIGPTVNVEYTMQLDIDLAIAFTTALAIGAAFVLRVLSRVLSGGNTRRP